jgi:hypothetical protein
MRYLANTALGASHIYPYQHRSLKMWAIKDRISGQYLTDPRGELLTFTTCIEDAWLFASYDNAEAEHYSEYEVVIEVPEESGTLMGPIFPFF